MVFTNHQVGLNTPVHFTWDSIHRYTAYVVKLHTLLHNNIIYTFFLLVSEASVPHMIHSPKMPQSCFSPMPTIMSRIACLQVSIHTSVVLWSDGLGDIHLWEDPIFWNSPHASHERAAEWAETGEARQCCLPR